MSLALYRPRVRSSDLLGAMSRRHRLASPRALIRHDFLNCKDPGLWTRPPPWRQHASDSHNRIVYATRAAKFLREPLGFTEQEVWSPGYVAQVQCLAIARRVLQEF